MNRFLLIIIVFLLFAKPSLHGQELGPDTSGIQHGKVYELKLKSPVKCIQHIEYDKTGDEPNWKLLDDKKTILIQDYIINTRIKLRVVFESGNEEEFSQSPCSIKLSESKPFL